MFEGNDISSELREQGGNCTRSTWLRQGSLDEGCRLVFGVDATAGVPRRVERRRLSKYH